VFTLDFSGLSSAGNPLILPLGKSGKFPDGLQVEFPSLKQYTVLTLASDPGVPIVAVAAGLILLGLIPSLYVSRRRVWLRAAPAEGGGVRVELAGLALQGKLAFVDEFKELAREVELGLLGSLSPEAGANLDRTAASRAEE
jgi:cytochrome c biogenesis protein ResB